MATAILWLQDSVSTPMGAIQVLEKQQLEDV